MIEDVFRFYRFFGIELQQGVQARSECPFCGSDKFFVSVNDPGKDPGVFTCKVCQVEGNHFTFIQTMYDESPYSDLTEISEDRGLPVEWLENYEFFDWFGDDFFPVRNKDGKIVSLCKIGEKFRPYAVPYLGQHLYGLQEYDDSSPIWLVEGQWDKMAWDYVLHHTDTPGICLACPGSNAFQDKWLGLFAGRTVNLLYDNDLLRHGYRCKTCNKITFLRETDFNHKLVCNGAKEFVKCKACSNPAYPNQKTIQPAQEGIERLLRKFGSMTKQPTVNVLKWPNGFKDGYDVRDLLTKGI